MSTLIVPALEDPPFPSLGGQVCDWIEEHLVYGPGELKGEPYKITPELQGILWRAYEVYPQGHKLAGRRRFKRVVISHRKGTGKTERMALLAITEAHPEAPVRCDGFDANGQPVGVGVKSPYIPLVAFSLTQTEDLAYAVCRAILEESSVYDDFDVGMERIMVLDGSGREAGKIVPLGGSPNARDGARTTFQAVDETHLLYLPRLKKSHNVMQQNIFKRVGADGWMLETTTAFEPGQNSVAEDAMDYAKSIDAGQVDDPRLFYFHRQANDDAPLDTKDDVRAALEEATGAETWSGDIDALVSHFFEPNTDRNYMRRVWLNQPVFGSGRAFNTAAWSALADPTVVVPDGSLIVLGFDGARRRDATALVAMDVEQSHMWPVGIWTRPEHADDDWEMPADEIEAAVEMMFDRFDVWRLYADPPYWETHVDEWAGRFTDRKGKPKVLSWWTNRKRPMAQALQSFDNAMKAGSFSHDGDSELAVHIGNAVRNSLNIHDEDDKPLWNIRKERSDSPLKIDGAMASTLCWEAYGDCLAAGKPRSRRSATLHSF